jgi:hypothetical protein
VFGSAILKNASEKLAYSFLESQWKRAFQVAAFVHDNETAQFVLGELWSKASELLSSEVKSSFEESTTNYSGLNVKDGLTTPGNQKSKMELWLESVDLKAREAAEAVKGKSAELHKLVNAPYFTYAPKVALDEEKAAGEIELSFWMKFLMDLDYLEVGRWEVVRSHRDLERVRQTVTSRAPIDVNPRAKEYPKSYDSGAKFQRVGYRQIGDIVIKRIDELNMVHYKQNFFEREDGFFGPNIEEISRSVIIKAYTNLAGLCNRNRTRARLKTIASE